MECANYISHHETKKHTSRTVNVGKVLGARLEHIGIKLDRCHVETFIPGLLRRDVEIDVTKFAEVNLAIVKDSIWCPLIMMVAFTLL